MTTSFRFATGRHEVSSAAEAIDVGTGTGRLARKLARRGAAEVVGVDATPEMLILAREAARREGWANLRFERVAVGAEPLPAAAAAFDLLTCGLMLCDTPHGLKPDGFSVRAEAQGS